MIDEFLAKKNEYEEFMDNIQIGPLFEEFFKRFPEVPGILIRGTTPSFNDGDACFHSSEVFMQLRDLWGWGIAEEGLIDELEDNAIRQIARRQLGEDASEIPEDKHEVVNWLDLSEAEAVMMHLEGIFEDRNVTNYQVSITKNDDGSVTIVEEEDYFEDW